MKRVKGKAPITYTFKKMGVGSLRNKSYESNDNLSCLLSPIAIPHCIMLISNQVSFS